MGKLIMFAVPDNLSDEQIVKELNKCLLKLHVKTELTILPKVSFGYQAVITNSTITILNEIMEICGDGKNRFNFTSNFYRAIANNFNTTSKDVKIILNEIIEGRNIPEVVSFVKENNISFIFNLAEEALGMMR